MFSHCSLEMQLEAVTKIEDSIYSDAQLLGTYFGKYFLFIRARRTFLESHLEHERLHNLNMVGINSSLVRTYPKNTVTLRTRLSPW